MGSMYNMENMGHEAKVNLYKEQEKSTHLKYRPDIDGLRAIAVLFVVGYHAFPQIFPGGFIGVDIFFVISGYLISTIIFEDLGKNRFDFLNFYARRIKRIFPALLLMLIVSYSIGWLLLSNKDFAQLGLHIAGGSTFSSNFLLWSEAGYFDTEAEKKPLLHLWSLGIEEQFYIFWPCLLWLCWKFKLSYLPLIILTGLYSFYLNIVNTNTHAITAFYLPHTRIWELLLGSALSWLYLLKKPLSSQKKIVLNTPTLYLFLQRENIFLKNILSLTGMLLLSYGLWKISTEHLFPGYLALIPTAAAVSIIAAGQQSWLNKVVLSHRYIVWIGLISFPLYLWHWPLLSIANILEGPFTTPPVRFLIVLTSVILAWATYKFIEAPIRFSKKNNFSLFLLALIFIIGSIGYATFKMQKNPLENSPPYKELYSTYKSTLIKSPRSSECFNIPFAYKKESNWFCELGDKNNQPEYFAAGDSHAESLLPALEKYASEHNTKILFAGVSGCPSLLGVQSMRGDQKIDKYNCRELNEKIFVHIKNTGIKNIILSNRWTYYTGSISRPHEFCPISKTNQRSDRIASKKDFMWALDNTVSRYKEIGVNVILVEDIPQQKYAPITILDKGILNDSDINDYSVNYNEHLENQKLVNEAIKKQNVKIVNFNKIICNGKVCPLVKDSKYIYLDDDHLTITGALMVYPVLKEALQSN